MSEDKIVPALVQGIPAFLDGTLYMPGEIAPLNLTQHEAKSVSDDQIVGLAEAPKSGEDIAIVPIAAVTAHVPEPTVPQGIPPGTRPSGTGRLLAPATDADAGAAREMKPATADVSDGATKKK